MPVKRTIRPGGTWDLPNADPVGPLNDHNLSMLAVTHPIVVCAWGVHAKAERVERVVEILKEAKTKMMCLGTTKDGHPRHPLMVRGDQPLVEYRP